MNENDFQNMQGNMPPKNNNALVIAITVLATLLIATLIAVSLYFITQKDNIGNTQPEVPVVEENIETEHTEVTGTTPTVMYVSHVENSVYFRRTAEEVSDNIICTIPLGTAVAFIDNENAIFAKVSYNDTEGFVKREYLSADAPVKAASSIGNTYVQKYMYVANVKHSIYLRSSASDSSNSNIICEIPLGTLVGYIERTNNVFSKIQYGSTIGYAKTQYLSDYSPYASYSSSYMTVCNVKHSIYLRSTPAEVSGNIICEIPLGSTVEYLGYANSTFYKIRWNGTTGYAKSIYLR